MLRIFTAIGVLLAIASSAFAQSEEEVAAARLIYLDGQYEEALKVLIPAAEAGNANAQNLLGDAYRMGYGVEQNTPLAIEWWEKSAAQDFAFALTNLARGYDYGYFPGGQDLGKAKDLYERGAALGNTSSMVNLGLLYETGQIEDENQLEMAVKYYRQAADLKYEVGLHNLANMYVYGAGVDESLANAMELFREAAAMDYAPSIGAIGAMYSNGYSVPQDDFAAAALYEIAARKSDGRSALNLAYFLLDESDLQPDHVQGWGWCLVSLQTSERHEIEANQQECDALGEKVSDADKAAGEAFAATILEE